MLETIKWNSRHRAREWMTIAGALVVQLSALNAKRQMSESEPTRPPWKRFDDTHHWDSIAEEWVPNMIGDHATHGTSRRLNSETSRSLR